MLGIPSTNLRLYRWVSVNNLVIFSYYKIISAIVIRYKLLPICINWLVACLIIISFISRIFVICGRFNLDQFPLVAEVSVFATYITPQRSKKHDKKCNNTRGRMSLKEITHISPIVLGILVQLLILT